MLYDRNNYVLIVIINTMTLYGTGLLFMDDFVTETMYSRDSFSDMSNTRGNLIHKLQLSYKVDMDVFI